MNVYKITFSDYDSNIRAIKCRAASTQQAIEKWLDRFDEDDHDLIDIELIIE